MIVSVALKLMKSCFKDVFRNEDVPLVHELCCLFPTGSTPSCWVCADFKWCILALWLKNIQLWEESLSLNCRVWVRSCLLPFFFFFFQSGALAPVVSGGIVWVQV